MGLYAWKTLISRFCSLILSGFNIEGHFIVVSKVIMNSTLCNACNKPFALILLSVSQFQAVSPNWFSNSRSFDIASSALSIDRKRAKKTSCAACLSTHCVLHKSRNVVSKRFLRFGEYSIEIIAIVITQTGVGGGTFRNPWNPLLTKPVLNTSFKSLWQKSFYSLVNFLQMHHAIGHSLKKCTIKIWRYTYDKI